MVQNDRRSLSSDSNFAVAFSRYGAGALKANSELPRRPRRPFLGRRAVKVELPLGDNRSGKQTIGHRRFRRDKEGSYLSN